MEQILATYKLKGLTQFVFKKDGIRNVTYKTIRNKDKEGEFMKIRILHRKTRRYKDGKPREEYAYLHPKLGKLIMEAQKRGYFDS